MRSVRMLVCGTAVAAALAVPVAPAAAAVSGESDVSVSPMRAYPGSTVSVSTEVCGPDATYAKGQAEAGGQINLTDDGAAGELAGDFTVPEGAEAGVYTITVKCPPRTRVQASFEVVDRPAGAVSGGFGGAGGLNGTQIAIGGLLIAGAAAGGMATKRRRAASATA
ncbi:hypothetical protein [Streptomyces sp. t39]|uniref:hypothetical protein n=1 Tax=Streptomyces sp. t39 TaxID=1828156 RepID=UPI0011CEB035|nr:hypothetical protein [Streptomyces sp. t39]TXS57631.1 hypothetical protein EAO77_17470 [Streptomyces sp. t39]